MSKALVTSYVNPDLDGVSCAVAYAELLEKTGVKTHMGLFGEPIIEAQFMFAYLGLKMPASIPDAHGYESICLMDVSELHMLEGRVPADKVVELIDHRKANDKELFPNAKAQIELVGAAATLVAERFEKAGITPSKQSAALLYGAIVSNTLNFKSLVVTDRDRRMAEWLREVSGLPEDFWKVLYSAKSDLSGDTLRYAIVSDAAHWRFKNGCMVMGQLEMIGVRKLVAERENEILNILGDLKKKENADYTMLNALDVEEGKTFLIAGDLSARDWCARVLELEFSGNVAIREGLILRKQTLPKLKEALNS